MNEYIMEIANALDLVVMTNTQASVVAVALSAAWFVAGVLATLVWKRGRK